MIKDIIIPNNSLFAVSVRFGMNDTRIEQYLTLSKYWELRLYGYNVKELPHIGIEHYE